MIVCEPTSGLTSRIYVMADAYQLAKDQGQELIIVWQKTSDCDCFYRDVFDEKQFADVPHRIIECNRFEYKLRDLMRGHTGKDWTRIIQEFRVRITFAVKYRWTRSTLKRRCTFFKNSYEDGNRLLNPEEIRGQNSYIEAYNCITGQRDLSCIHFQNRFRMKAAEILQGQKCVGIHIRRTDHRPATEGSSTDHFIQRMKQIAEDRPEIKFYVATDDWEEQRRLTELFGKRILTNPDKVLTRSSRQGMEDAVIDMLCLSQTEYILGSYASIFSKFSAEYGGIRLEIV